jgi:chromatin remodeling complex protein RSC6
MSDEQIDTLDNWIIDQFSTINNSLSLFKLQISSLQKIVKNVEKDVRKELKNIKKDKLKNKPKIKRAPSGFAKPTRVTKELCEFMNKPEGSEIARTEVTQTLVNYIKENNLVGTSDDTKNKIIPDDKLKTLLGIQDDEIQDLNYFNIQKYMNRHFKTSNKKEINAS